MPIFRYLLLIKSEYFHVNTKTEHASWWYAIDMQYKRKLTYITELGFSVHSADNIINRTNNRPMSLYTTELVNIESSIGTHLNRQNYCILKPSSVDRDHGWFHPHNASGANQTKTCLCIVYTLLVASNVALITTDCTKPQDLFAKCSLCSGPHIVNLKGCPSYKQFQSSHNKEPSLRSDRHHIHKTSTKTTSNVYAKYRHKPYVETVTFDNSPIDIVIMRTVQARSQESIYLFTFLGAEGG